MRRLALIPFAVLVTIASAQQGSVLTGQAAFTDWNQERPGARHRITLADLPAPHPEESVQNTPKVIPRPEGAMPVAPVGFKVTLYAGGDNAPMQRADNVEHMARVRGTFTEPRLLRAAPNGDLYLADSGAGNILRLRGVGPDGKAASIETYATGLDHPFGIAFYPADNPHWIYIGNATTIVRIPYSENAPEAWKIETIVPDVPGYAQLQGGGHWTRDVAFSLDSKHMFISVGSGSNIDDPDTHPREFHRADVLEYTPDGKFEKVYASGIRNCVGEAVNPVTGALWCSTNERDALGNHLVPDYVTSVPEGSFFGWPWYYMGGKLDPRLKDPCAAGSGPNPQLIHPLADSQSTNCKREDISRRVRTPDVIVQPHMASLEMVFYPHMLTLGTSHAPGWHDSSYPASYQGGIFAAEHGSWNRANRAGYEVIYIPTVNGKATGEYDDFLTGFVTSDGHVWGRPVGVTVGKGGDLYVTDDGSRSVWRVQYVGE